MGTRGLFMSASKDQVKFLQLTPESFLWPGSMPNTVAAELGPMVPRAREVIDEGIAVSSG